MGHKLGLRHNFKASSIYSLEKINSDEIKGKETLAGSVMDYLPINMYKGVGKKQGDHTMTGIGPYDMWAIEYGYSIVSKPEELKKILIDHKINAHELMLYQDFRVQLIH